MGLDAPAAEVTLTLDEVRRMTLRAQGFLGATSWNQSRASLGSRVGVVAMLRRVGAVQLATISVLARSHELVAYARLGPVSRQQIEQAYWHATKPGAFEYWAHAACVLPVEQWPYFAFLRRALRARGVRWHQSHQETCDKGLARLVADAALAAGLVPVAIAGPAGPTAGAGAAWGWADPAALEAESAGRRGRNRVTLLSPFDSLIWDRKRTRQMFGFEHSLEAYVPKHKRVHGYFTMPLLAGGRLAGRVDPGREGKTLVARQRSLDRPPPAGPMAE